MFSQACGYYQKNSLTAKWWFNVGTDGCKGASECQFKTLEEAKKFCDHKPTCTAILRQEGSSNCAGGHGCFTPRKYDLEQNLDWKGKTYVKDCGGKISFSSLGSGVNILLSFVIILGMNLTINIEIETRILRLHLSNRYCNGCGKERMRWVRNRDRQVFNRRRVRKQMSGFILNVYFWHK